MDVLENIPIYFSTVDNNKLISLLLFDHDKFYDTKNLNILMPTERSIKDSKIVDEEV